MTIPDSEYRRLADGLQSVAPSAYLMLMDFADGYTVIWDSWCFDALERRGLATFKLPDGPQLTELGAALAAFIRQPRDLPTQLSLF